jgi:hypothetical protein
MASVDEKEKKTCFVICPIDKEGNEKRIWSDKVLKYIIEPAAKPAGYDVFRADKVTSPGMISNQIIQHLYEDDVVIADLSFHNPNVFYELAIRHVTKKPYIQLIKADQKIPFDIAINRTIRIDTDVEIAAKAVKDLEKQLKSIDRGNSIIDNPIGNADILLKAQKSGIPNQITNAKIIEAISAIESQMYRIEQKIELQSVSRSPEFLLGATDEQAQLARLDDMRASIEEIDKRIIELEKTKMKTVAQKKEINWLIQIKDMISKNRIDLINYLHINYKIDDYYMDNWERK